MDFGVLKLSLKKTGNQLRESCTACGNEDERIVVITPSRGLFYCYNGKVGGDCLALVQPVTGLDVQDAAAFLSPHSRAAHNSQAPQGEESGCDEKNTNFAGGIRFQAPITEQVEQLGFTEAVAKDFSIGFYRGRVYIHIRHTDGSISGFVGYADGQLKLPKWLPATPTWSHFQKRLLRQ
jgi:hypothetical protein